MWNFIVPKTKFKSIDARKTSKNPTLIGNVKHIFCIFISIFLVLHGTEELVTLLQNHFVEHRIMRTDLEDKDGKKVQLEEIAVAHVNLL